MKSGQSQFLVNSKSILLSFVSLFISHDRVKSDQSQFLVNSRPILLSFLSLDHRAISFYTDNKGY